MSAERPSLFPDARRRGRFPMSYFSDRCNIMVKTAKDTYVGCGLKIGHDGPHQPPKPPKQVVTCAQ